MKLLITKGRIIDPGQSVDHVGDLLIIDGKIVEISPGITSPPSDCRILPAEDMIVCPGFIDLHCHLRYPGFEEKEDILSGTKAAAAGGFTTVCCMPNTNPPLDNIAVLKQLKAKANSDAIVNILPISAVSIGQFGETLTDMESMVQAGAVAFSDDGKPVHNAKLMRKALGKSISLNVPIIDHCEDLTLSQNGSMNEGALSSSLGYPGIPSATEDQMVKRDIELAKKTDGQLHIAHVSTAGSVDLIRNAKKQGVRVTAEVTPHHLMLTEDAILAAGTNAKVNPPLRTKHDTEALTNGLNDGTIDAIATDHAPHTLEDKAKAFDQASFGISGLETALGILMMLVSQGKLSLATVISKLTFEPAQIIHATNSGTLKAGSPADITVFNPQSEWIVDPQNFSSKGKNTPLVGITLKGKVIRTIVAGRVMFST